MLTFDVSDRESFDHIATWRQEFTHYADVRDPDAFPFVLLGNKCDVAERRVTEAEALALCQRFNDMPYFETSAKDNINVQRAFVAAAEQLKRSQPVLKAEFSATVNLKAAANKKSGCC
jgi:GTPase SAR1 family protein